MDDMVTFASRDYCLCLLLLVFARGMDFLSTWIATPNLVLEGNPLAKKLGWKCGLALNVVLCVALAAWPLSAIVVATASVLVAARNFQSAWLTHSLGEEIYRQWHVERVRETRITLYLLCLAGNTLLTAGVGAALIYFSNLRLVPFAIGKNGSVLDIVILLSVENENGSVLDIIILLSVGDTRADSHNPALPSAIVPRSI